MAYALGREIDSHDLPAIRKIEQTAKTTDYKWSSVVLGIVSSSPFQMRAARPAETGKLAAQ
jgi:hypothetical protein